MLSKIFGKEISQSEFLEQYFGRKPLYVPRVNELAWLYSIEDMDQFLIQHEGDLHNLVRITKNGPRVTVPGHAGDAKTQRAFILNEFRNGATIKIEQLESRHPELSRLAFELETIFGGYVFAKPFLTPANYQGLSLHFDTTEVIVIQMEGTKHWKVWDKVIDKPSLPMLRYLKEEELPKPLVDVVLEPGDVLYVPAGCPHVAVSGDAASLHMSVGIEPVKLYEMLEGYIRIMSEHIPELRELVCPFSDMVELDRVASSLFERMATVPLEGIYDAYKVSYAANKPDISNARLRTLTAQHKIDASSMLKLKDGARVSVREDDDKISIYLSSTLNPDKPLISTPSNLSLPAYCKSEIYSLLNQKESFTPSALSGDLNQNGKVLMCRKLAEYGLIDISL